jgi:hypothetical protein
MGLLRLDPRRWLLMAVVLPLTGRLLLWSAAEVRARNGSSRTADRMEWLGNKLHRRRSRRH